MNMKVYDDYALFEIHRMFQRAYDGFWFANMIRFQKYLDQNFLDIYDCHMHHNIIFLYSQLIK